jgi:hypothetical protein
VSYIISGERVPVKGSSALLLRNLKQTIPLPPFPGLWIGALKVSVVECLHGGDPDEISVQYSPVSKRHAAILEANGWWYET